jgi:hypothetical protein
MDLFLTFLFLFLILFVIKIYFVQQKNKEGFQFHRRKHNPPPKPPKKSNTSNTNTSKKTKKDDLVENMDMPNPVDEIEKVSNDLQDLKQVYKENTTGYAVAGANSPVELTIPEIPDIPEFDFALPSLNIPIPSLGPGIPGMDIPLPLNQVTQPIQEVVDFFINIMNIFLDFCNTVIDALNIAIHYSTCAFTLLINFFTIPCAFWYILDLVGRILYLPFLFIFWLLGLVEVVNQYIWGPIYIADEVFHDYTGFHFAHFPDNIMKGCYSCPAEFEVFGMSNFSWIGDTYKNMFDLL